jgi:starch synthase
MYIIHLTSEFSPIAKVGGLGDVVAGLSNALAAEVKRIEVFLPFYDHIKRHQLNNLKVIHENFMCEALSNTIWSAQVNGISMILIEPQNNYFKRGRIYGEEDDNLRFMYFTLTAMEYLLKANKHPDVLHLHDWPSALAAPLYHEKYHSLGLKVKGIMTSIHNMKYQGVCEAENLSRIGLNPDLFLKQDKLQDHTKPDEINLLKGALIYSDSLTTVSPSYAEEIKGKEGFGLESILKEKEKKLQGILNGIDTHYWNPETDPFLKKNYPPRFTSLDEIREVKRENRKALDKMLQIDYDPNPLFTCITRLVQQKGPAMIRFGLEYILKKGGQFILLASTPEDELKESFHILAEEYRDNPHVHFHFVFNEELAHLSFAAADCILIPSLFEPCGLTQMIALRYGTIPIVHKVGGLKDTIFDIDHKDHPMDQRNGYTFDFPSNDSLQWSIDRAFEHLKHDPKKWECMLNNGFSRDWSWKVPALKYLEIYKKITNIS